MRPLTPAEAAAIEAHGVTGIRYSIAGLYTVVEEGWRGLMPWARARKAASAATRGVVSEILYYIVFALALPT